MSVDKILNAEKDVYVVFYDPGCPWCRKALSAVKDKKHINILISSMPALLKELNARASEINFKASHRTKPLIFYNGSFIGGFTELDKFLTK